MTEAMRCPKCAAPGGDGFDGINNDLEDPPPGSVILCSGCLAISIVQEANNEKFRILITAEEFGQFDEQEKGMLLAAMYAAIVVQDQPELRQEALQMLQELIREEGLWEEEK